MKFEVNDLKAIGEALEGIVEKMQEQFSPVAFDITLEYPGLEIGSALLVRMTSIENQPWRFSVDISEKPVEETP
jgi:hypothetical protein